MEDLIYLTNYKMEVTLFTNCLLFVIGVSELEVIQKDVGIDEKIGRYDRRCLFWRFGGCFFTLKVKTTYI